MQVRFWRGLFVCAALLWGLPGAGDAQSRNGGGTNGGDLSHDAVAPRAQAIRAAQPIQIDGFLDEAVWSEAPPITRFTQLTPDEGEPVSQRTDVRLVYDDQALYIGAMLYDTGPIATILARRDAMMSESDAFAVLLDSHHDHQTAYRFGTNPSGMKQDQIVSSGRNDSSWDPVWDVATRITDAGWSVEMRIPFSQLRFSQDREQVWGIQVQRIIRRRGEEAVFAFTPLLERDGVHRFGHLDGVSDIRSGQRLELLPYLTGRAEYLRPSASAVADFPNPYAQAPDWATGAGLDLKYRVSSNLTLDATVNPDFGQVEVDPAVINLSAFETRYMERRPFFVEGAEIFRFGEGGPRGSVGSGPEVLYTRRIGRSPQGTAPSTAVFAEKPEAATILGAAKLSGRVGDGWSVGVLQAVTGNESIRYIDRAGVEGTVRVEPATSYLLGRARRDVRNGDTRFGAMATAVNRDLGDPLLASRLHSAAYTAGVDFVHQWSNRTWRLNGSFSPSYVRGDREAIFRTQRASTRYYQRPDAAHLELDPDATSLAGYYAMAMFEKQAGAWTGRIGGGMASPGYEVNDLGFQTGADRILFDTHLQYNQTRPGRHFRSWGVWGGPNGIWNYAGEHLLDNTNINGRLQFANYWSSFWRVAYSIATYDDRLTRGGPLARSPAGWQGNVNLTTDSRKAYTVRGNVFWGFDESGSWNHSTNLNVNFKARENWEFQVGPELSRRHAAAQYVTNLGDPRAVDTFERRYVFGELDQTTFGIDTRVNVTFTPALSLQMYTQPFLSTGRYESLKELRAPRTFEFLEYGADIGSMVRQPDGFYRIDPDGSGTGVHLIRDPDFRLRSLRGNAVLRWEWRAGSTLYLVWQQRRVDSLTGLDLESDPGRAGNLELAREARALVGIRPDNIFAIKATYWLNP
jgi:hypothetical protein